MTANRTEAVYEVDAPHGSTVLDVLRIISQTEPGLAYTSHHCSLWLRRLHDADQRSRRVCLPDLRRRSGFIWHLPPGCPLSRTSWWTSWPPALAAPRRAADNKRAEQLRSDDCAVSVSRRQSD